MTATRVDGADIVRAGEYLPRLAAAVVESLLADEALTRESACLRSASELSRA